MKTIAFFCYNIDTNGGLERVVSLIVNGLAEEKNLNIKIISLKREEKRFFSIGNNVDFFYLDNLKNYYSVIKETRKIILAEDIDYLITADSLMAFICLPANTGLSTKLICWEHYSFFSSIVNTKRKLARYLVKKYFYKIVLLTERDKYNWEVKPSSKVLVIENPSPFLPKKNKNKFESNYILAVGRLRYEKGFDMLLHAWSKVNSSFRKNNKLIIVGEGEEKKKLEDLIDDLNIRDSVLIEGFTKNIEKYYNSCKFYCLTSRTEAFPMVLIEALAFSTPLLAFDCYTGPKEIIENSINGYLVEEGNIVDFSEKIEYMFNLERDKFNELSDNAYLSSLKYDLVHTLNKWLSVFD